MGKGYLQVETTTAFEALPVSAANIVVMGGDGEILCQLSTDENGVTDTLALYAPDASATLAPGDPGPYYAAYNVEVTAQGFETVSIQGVQVFDGQTSLLPVDLSPALRSGQTREVIIPANELQAGANRLHEGSIAMTRYQRQVYIPDYITVHLGAPTSNVRNLRVSFTDYIKNVASSEIYPTWPQAALEANIYAQISFALNRVYTEWYVSRGYPFHITSSTAYDQSFVEGRNIFANISQLVDNIFNVFVRRAGYAEPFFTQYCNGTTVTCNGLSQWGTVSMANQGLNAYQILLRYYPSDIQLISTDNITGVTDSYPGTPLRQGSQGDAVRTMQVYLNRIRVNYPLIPQIANPNGVFGADTAGAVRTFQQIFSLTADSIIGKSTWYKIVQIYTSIKKLADLNSEGERIGIGTTPPTSTLREGSRGADVVQLQFLLNYIAEFYHDIPVVLETSVFDNITRLSVIAFQQKFSLTADGVVGAGTWRALYQVYNTIHDNTNVDPGPGTQPPVVPPEVNPPYPGTLLRNGSRGESVLLIQRYLNEIFRYCPGYQPLSEDSIFGAMTTAAVRSFQETAGLSQDGIVGPLTWNAIVTTYNQAVSR